MQPASNTLQDVIPAASSILNAASDEALIALNFCGNALDLANGARCAYSSDAPARNLHASYGPLHAPLAVAGVTARLPHPFTD